MPDQDFFQKPQQPDRRREHNGQGRGGALPPEVPQGAEQGAEQEEEQGEAPRCAQQHVQPQLPVPEAQGKVEQAHPGHQAIHPVQQGDPPAAGPEPQGPQQVVHQPQGHPQAHCPQEGGQLTVDVDPHQPNSRLRSPPPLRPLSS